MNLHITTSESGEIKRYSLDFLPWEYPAALETIKNLRQNVPQKSPSIIGGSVTENEPAANEKVCQLAEKMEKKQRLQPKNGRGLNIPAESLHASSSYIKPNILQGLASIQFSKSSWYHMQNYKRVAKTTWDKLANGFRIPYSIEDGTIIVTPQQLPQFEEITDCIEKKMAENFKQEGGKGVFVRYKAGGNLIDKWMAEEDEKEVTKKLKAIYEKKSKMSGYPITFKIQEIKRMSYEEYKHQYINKI